MDSSERLQGKTFSARSQDSFPKEAALRVTLSNAVQKLNRLNLAIAAGEERLKRHEQAFLDNETYATTAITDELGKIRGWRDELLVYEPLVEKVQGQIDALLNPGPEEAQARADIQKQVALLAIERLDCDRELALVLQKAKELLEKRAETTERLWSLLESLDFHFANDHLDDARFRPLQDGIPQNVIETSEAWVAGFLGEAQPVGTFRVLGETLLLRETLVSPHAYQRGDCVQLTAGQLAEAKTGDKVRLITLPEVRDGAVHGGSQAQIHEPCVEECEQAEAVASGQDGILSEV